MLNKKIPFTISIIISQEPFVSPSAFGCRLKEGGRDILNEERTCVNTRYKNCMSNADGAEGRTRTTPHFIQKRAAVLSCALVFVSVPN